MLFKYMENKGRNENRMKKYLDVFSHVGAGVVYFSYLLLFVVFILDSICPHNESNEFTLYLVSEYTEYLILVLLFAIAPVLQIIGAYPFWRKQLPEQWDRQKWCLLLQRIYICAGYILNIIAIVWAYLLSNIS